MSCEPTIGEYVIGVEGLALLRLAFSDDARGRAARVAEIGDLLGQLDDGTRLRAPVGTEYDLQSGYQQWSATYDQPLRLFSIEEPPMQALIGTIPAGPALDAACGTGRYSTYLAGRGHSVIGVDQSEAMLDLAREKLPAADFRRGDLTALPLPDNSVGAVLCALALVHVPDISAALREFARVLRPGGRLVISDSTRSSYLSGGRRSSPLRTVSRDSCACTAIFHLRTSARGTPLGCGSGASTSRRSPQPPPRPRPPISCPTPTGLPSSACPQYQYGTSNSSPDGGNAPDD